MGDHPFRFSVAILAFSVLAVPSFAANKPAANDSAVKKDTAQQQNLQKKVWTNADLDQLRNRDAISIVGVGPEEEVPPEPAPADQGAKTKVWTNEDVEKLRNPDVLSIVPSTEATPQQPAPPAAAVPSGAAEAAPAESAPAEAAPYSQFTDPRWYAEQAYGLRVELAQREARLAQYLYNIALAHDGVTQAGIGFFSGDEGVTPEAGVQNLESQIQSVLIELDKLGDMARRNGISPGVLRG